MNLRSALISSLAAVTVVAAAPAAAQAAAQAADCARPGVTVAASSSKVTAGEQVDYSYKLCFNSTPDHFDAQVFRIAADGTMTPATSATTRVLTASDNGMQGAASMAPSADGDYVIRVRYFATGQARAETVGEATFHANPLPQPPVAPPVTPQPPVTPPVTPDSPATPQGNPVPTPVQQITTAVSEDAAPAPQGAPQTRITLVKRAVRTTVKKGKLAPFTLTVKNTGRTAAKDVKVCDTIPAHTQYVSASRSVTFTGSKACMKVGTLAAGKTQTLTITLRVDRNTTARKITNHAIATASNAPSAKAQAAIKVPASKTLRVKAPVTG